MFTPVVLENGMIPRSTPEEQGISSRSILDFVDRIREMNIDLHAFALVRHGKLVAEAVGLPYTENSFHRIYSSAKGIVATAILVAVQEGYFGLNDRAIDLLPKELIPEDLDPRWERLTVYHLLTMTDGHGDDTLRYLWGGGEHWIRTFFKIKPDYEPGTHFCYDMGAQYVMNEIVKSRTGEDTGSFLKPRVFDKLGIEYTANFNEYGMFFSSSVQLKPQGLTRLGLLYLQEGEWNGQQLIRKDLAVMASLPHVPNAVDAEENAPASDKNAGYGLHMWRNRIGGYRFSGGEGQYSIILPEYDMVFSTMAADNNPDRICDAFYDCIARKSWYYPIAEDPQGFGALKELTENFNLAPIGTAESSPNAEKLSGRVFEFEENDWGLKKLSFEFGETVTVNAETLRGLKSHKCGLGGNWTENRGFIIIDREDGDISDLDLIFNEDRELMLLSGGWKNDSSFVFYMRGPALLCDYRFTFDFSEDALSLSVFTRAHNHRKSGEKMGSQSCDGGSVYRFSAKALR